MCRPVATGHFTTLNSSVFYMQITTCSITLETTPVASLSSPCRRHARYVSGHDVVTERSNITLGKYDFCSNNSNFNLFRVRHKKTPLVALAVDARAETSGCAQDKQLQI